MDTAPYFHFYARVSGYDGLHALLSDDANPDTAIVFVHGFAGHATKTWLNFEGLVDCSHIRPEIWKQADLFFYGYDSVTQHIYQNGERLLSFIKQIFPTPAAGTFTVTRDLVKNGRYLAKQTERVAPSRKYKTLVLVGHSEGGLVIRQSLWTAAQREGEAALDQLALSTSATLFHARLRLFAPALLGASITGLISMLFYSLALGSFVRFVVRSSPAYADMTNEAKKTEIRSGTEKYAAKWPALTGFKAHVLWGEQESIVTPGNYACDIPDGVVTGRDHVSLCKPSEQYQKPLEFVSEF